MDGGAWPFLVGGVICLVNSDNERDSPLLTSRLDLDLRVCLFLLGRALHSVRGLSAAASVVCGCSCAFALLRSLY